MEKTILKLVLYSAKTAALALAVCFLDISSTWAERMETHASDLKREKEELFMLSGENPVDITVSGTVTDQNGEPLPGVTVSVPGTVIGTATDLDGRYSLTVPEGSTLSFSFIGFETQSVPVDDQSVVNVTLVEDISSLDEVVVVGYGTQKRADIIGAVSEVSADQLEGRNVSQLSQSLTGQMPGVTIIQRSGRPGSGGGEISIRGVGSFGADPAALVLIDGIPGNLNDINPNDVASVSVLKD